MRFIHGYEISHLILLAFALPSVAVAQSRNEGIDVLALYTGKNDQAHISFVREADKWFARACRQNGFRYTASTDWNKLNSDTLNKYALVVFLDTRPEDAGQRHAFERYMRNGGAWIGFHFAAFALTPSQYPDNWDWYQNEFLGCGEYEGNTWRPTSAVLRIEDRRHPVTKHLPVAFSSSPNEWYRWKRDLRSNRNIDILLSIDPNSFPLGTGPKPEEIWHSGYYPVVWSNKRYRMVYFNMGHNDIDYEGKTNKTLSYTFGNELQDRLVMNAVLWLLRR